MEDCNQQKSLEGFNESMGFEPIGQNIPLKDFFNHSQCECGYAPHEKVDKQILRLMKKNKQSYNQDIASIEENIRRETVCSGK